MKTIKQEAQNLYDQFQGNDGQKKANHGNTKGNHGSGVNVLKQSIEIFFYVTFHINIFLKIYATSSAIIPKAKLLINIKNFRFRVLGFKSAMYADTNQAADKLAIISESIFKKIGSTLTGDSLMTVKFGVNQIQTGAVG